jgi:short subunit dehydrogenase-like uncharacterized protein
MTTASKRKFDVLVWGATGFTGKLVCKYLNEEYPSVNWAMAGRNLSKLEQVKKELKISCNIPILTADLIDPSSLDRAFSQAKVVLTTAGPYAKIGTEVLKSCIRVKSHYCDLTGEAPWIRQMIDAHDADAKANKVRIVNSSGFDCIPSDLGCQFMAEEMLRRGLQPKHVRLLLVDAKGGASGGTIASLLAIFDFPLSVLREFTNPYFLNQRKPDGQYDQPIDPSIRSAASDNTMIGYDKVMRTWTMPYIMQGIDTRIVNRSNSLLDFIYGRNFLFTERMKQSFPVALVGSLLMPLIGGLFFMSFTRSILKHFLPKPGTGPSEKSRDQGYFKMALWGEGLPKSGDSKPVLIKGGITAMNGDPGYKVSFLILLMRYDQ